MELSFPCMSAEVKGRSVKSCWIFPLPRLIVWQFMQYTILTYRVSAPLSSFLQRLSDSPIRLARSPHPCSWDYIYQFKQAISSIYDWSNTQANVHGFLIDHLINTISAIQPRYFQVENWIHVREVGWCQLYPNVPSRQYQARKMPISQSD